MILCNFQYMKLYGLDYYFRIIIKTAINMRWNIFMTIEIKYIDKNIIFTEKSGHCQMKNRLIKIHQILMLNTFFNINMNTYIIN